MHLFRNIKYIKVIASWIFTRRSKRDLYTAIFYELYTCILHSNHSSDVQENTIVEKLLTKKLNNAKVQVELISWYAHNNLLFL